MMGRELLLMLILVAIIPSHRALAEEDPHEEHDTKEEMEIYKMAMDFMDECGSKEWSLCLKERALRYLETLPNELDIAGAVKVIPNGKLSRKNTDDKLPDEPRAREDAVDSILWDRVSDYLSSHTIELRVPPNALQEINESVEEGRGRGGGGGGKGGGKGGGNRMGGLMMLISLKAAVLGAIALKFVALVAFKALLIAKIALVLASVISLKKLVEQKHHSSTVEVVAAHPHHEPWDHYDRSFNQEQLAYRGYEGAARSISA